METSEEAQLPRFIKVRSRMGHSIPNASVQSESGTSCFRDSEASRVETLPRQARGAASSMRRCVVTLSRSIPQRSQVRDAHRSQRAPSRWFGEALPLLPIESAPRARCRRLDGIRRVFAFRATLTANRGYVIGLLDPDPEYVLSAPGTRFVPASPRLPINLPMKLSSPAPPPRLASPPVSKPPFGSFVSTHPIYH